jgi:large-conductance mechanosensitive channel
MRGFKDFLLRGNVLVAFVIMSAVVYFGIVKPYELL